MLFHVPDFVVGKRQPFEESERIEDSKRKHPNSVSGQIELSQSHETGKAVRIDVRYPVVAQSQNL